MPKRYGVQRGRIRERQQRSSIRNVTLDVFDSPRRDPRGASSHESVPESAARISRAGQQGVQNSPLQRASATGGAAVTRRARPHVARVTAERQPSGILPRSTTLDFSVRVFARVAPPNRACAAATLVDGAYAHNHRRAHQALRCTLQNGLPAKSSAAHGVHG